MAWNWQNSEWPNFIWDKDKLHKAEALFLEGRGVLMGLSQHLKEDDQQSLFIELMSSEAFKTSEIEGELLNRESIQSSIMHHLGLSKKQQKLHPSEAGISEMMVNLYKTLDQPLSHQMLYRWHTMVTQGRQDLQDIGKYRTDPELMQIVSGPDYARKVHFEAPPSQAVFQEMELLINWINSPKSQEIPLLVKAGLAHLWFESIHPFEDGNGRIGRAISEKILAHTPIKTPYTALSETLMKNRKDYYKELALASQTLEVNRWLLWFSTIILEAQQKTKNHINFILHKAKLFASAKGSLNTRQEKVLLRMFQEGPEGFTGGLSASNYEKITGSLPATTTRDLRDLVEKNILLKTGERKSTRYFLNIPALHSETYTVEDIS